MMVILALKLLNLLILFQGILGYRFREKMIWLTAGTALVFFEYLVDTVVMPDGGELLRWLQVFIPAAGTILLFEGRKSVVFAISACMMCVYSLLYSTGIGIAILARKGIDIIDIDLEIVYIITLLVCAAVMAVFAVPMKKFKKVVHYHVEDTNPLLLMVFLLCCRIFEYNPWYVGDSSDTLPEIIRGQNQVKNGIVVLIVFLGFVLICVLVSLRKEMNRLLYLNEKCIKEQTEQYRLLSDGDTELRKFRHDYNDHIGSLQALDAAGDTEGVSRYIQDMTKIQAQFSFFHTNSIISDAILNRYAKLCKDSGFDLEVKGGLPDGLLISETNLCIVLSNGIKNAYEAAKKCRPEERKLIVEMTHRASFVYISIYNSAAEEPVIKDGVFATTKKDHKKHGLGMKNMQEAVEKNGGMVQWEYHDSMVKTVIMLKREAKG